MRVSVVLAALAAVVSASSFGKRQIPDCALSCMTTANTGDCSATDNTCLCKSEPFVTSTYACIASTCKGDDLNQALAAAQALCAAAGVTLTSTPALSTASATSPPSGSATSRSTTASSTAASASSTSNAAIGFTGASPMVGALAAVAGVVFAL